MKKGIAILGLMSLSFSVQAATVVPSFLDGATVSCVAYHNIGNDGQGYSEKKMDVFYRIDDGQKQAQAYFKEVVKLGDYSFDGSCGPEVCDLSIRDMRTNTVSNMNAAYAKLNQNSSQIQIMNFKENLTLTLRCELIQKEK